MSAPFIWDVEREIIGYGPIALRWYSLLFALGFVFGYFIVQRFFRAEGKDEAVLDSLLFHLVIGTVVGARLGHCLLYEPMDYLTDPLRILKIWEGGLASHGGFTGVTIALILFSRKYPDYPFLWVIDRCAPPTLMTAGFIRLGNFFNSEIIGKPWDGPWAVVFKKNFVHGAPDTIARHPTQIYEALGYFGIALILWAIYRAANRKPLDGRIFGWAMILGYTFRLFIETFKENQVAFEESMFMNMGQLLSVPFILGGIFFASGMHARIPLFWKLMSNAPEHRAGSVGRPDLPDDSLVDTKSRRGAVRRQMKKGR